ncbi:hypothetical protein J6590_080891 [Homalodisca vitripennis]|nr:hypothetical protein J6590_080891 [Homalodisca vitripennis]
MSHDLLLESISGLDPTTGLPNVDGKFSKLMNESNVVGAKVLQNMRGQLGSPGTILVWSSSSATLYSSLMPYHGLIRDHMS